MNSSDISLWAKSFGARIFLNINKHTTHVVAARNRTAKVRQAARIERIKVVNTQWLLDSISQWQRLAEDPYLIPLHPEDLKRKSGEAKAMGDESAGDDDNSSMSTSDDGDDDLDETGDELRDDADDPDGVVPSDLDDSHSPVDGFEGYNWKADEDDLADFLGSDNEDDSENDSVASESTLSAPNTPKKRKRSRSSSRSNETAESNGDHANAEPGGSQLAKRQQLARSRTTGLKTVAIAQGEAPRGGGGGEEGVPRSSAAEADEEAGTPRDSEGDLNDDDFSKEIEAELEREFSNE